MNEDYKNIGDIEDKIKRIDETIRKYKSVKNITELTILDCSFCDGSIEYRKHYLVDSECQICRFCFNVAYILCNKYGDSFERLFKHREKIIRKLKKWKKKLLKYNTDIL